MTARAGHAMSCRARLAAVALIAAGTGILSSGAAADSGGQARPATAFPRGHYAALDALPDWGGVWTLNFSPPAPGAAPAGPDLKGQYRKEHAAWLEQLRATGGLVARKASNCLPPGLPGIMGVPQYPIEFLFTPGRVTLHHEAWMQWRTIYTDGRGHPDDWDPTFYGHSIGQWEAGTLIVDTVGIKESVDMGMGVKHSAQLRVIERFHLAPGDPDTLVVDTTLEDPLALNQPWRTTRTYARARAGELLEFICEENDRNPVDAAGKTGFE
jgi:hypothetical protein